MADRPDFFSELDRPLISMELGRPRVVLPGPEYPGDPDWWESGFDAYAMGWPMRNGARVMKEAESWMHGYLTARMADLLGAAVPDGLPDVGQGESPWGKVLHRGGTDRGPEPPSRSSLRLEDLFCRSCTDSGECSCGEGEDGGEPEFTAEELCPVDGDEAPEERAAWIEGYRSSGITFAADYGGLGDARYAAFREGQRTRMRVERGDLDGPVPGPLGGAER
jgi:hypothetical protein